MSKNTTPTPTLEEAIEALKAALVTLTPEAGAPATTVTTEVAETACGATTKAGTPCKNEAGKCRHHEVAEVTTKAPKAKAPKKGKATTVKVEVTGGNRVTKASIKVLRELGVTATGKRSLEVVQRRAKVAGITIEPVPYGTL